jgi:serine/threonine-protein phosphatase CPPED1
MKRPALGLVAVGLVCVAVAWSDTGKPGRPELDFKTEARNPVTHLRLNNGPDSFQFAVVSDRTGGHRPKVFSRAVEQLNLLQPEFVVSVGDLIEGYTEDRGRIAAEWREFQTYASRLQMPFFYVPGNHDITNPVMDALWREKFGRRYYDVVYKNVLFLMLNSEDPPTGGGGKISPEQVEFVKKSLEANRGVRWTLAFLHKPLWVYSDPAKNGWLEVEKALGDRPYTVFAGHVHRYQKFVRNGRNFYQLATTGGGSKLRGTDYGEFDHLVWITMKPDGPVLANVLLDGILPEDLKSIETGEPGQPQYGRRFAHPARGRVTFEGQPVPGAYVQLQIHPTPKDYYQRVYADAFAAADGTFVLSTYEANDGVPEGEYAVTVVWRKPFYDEAGKPGPNLLPEKYAKPATTPLKAVIKAGVNELVFELQK